MRLGATLRWDVTLQFRYGFYYASAFFVLIWVVLLGRVPARSLGLLLPGFLVNHMVVTTFYFMAALVLLEKGEGTLQGLVVTPLRASEYLVSKTASLVLLVVVESVLITVLSHGATPGLAWLALGVTLVATTYTLLGFIAVARYDSINEFLMPSVVVVAFLTLPLVDLLGVWRSPLFYLHPLQPPLLLMRAAFVPLGPWQIVYGLLGSLVWAGLSFAWARRLFHVFVVRTVGGVRKRHSGNGAFSVRAQNVFTTMGRIDLKNVRRDSMLVWLPLLPLVPALLVRWGLPRVAPLLGAEFGVSLEPYHPLIASGFLLLTPMFAGMLGGFLLLDERDDRTLTALMVTPMPLGGYLLYRTLAPALLGFVTTLAVIPVVGLVTVPLGPLLAIALLASVMAPLLAIFLASVAANKVAGMAILKMVSTALMVPAAAFVAPMPWQLAAGLVPTYWALKAFWLAAAGDPALWRFLAAGFVANLLFLAVFLRRFDAAVHR